MNAIYVKADNYILAVKSNCVEKIVDYMCTFDGVLNKLTISFRILEENNFSRVDGTIIYCNCNNYFLKYDEKNDEITFECPWEKINKSSMFAIVFRYYIELIRQRNKEIKLHASAVSRENRTICLMAPSEGGKTTTAMALSQKRGFQLKSNDATVAAFENDIPYMLRGDCVINARMNGLEAYSVDLLSRVKNGEKGETNPWNSKVNISPDELGIDVDIQKRRIDYIIFVKLDALVENVLVTRYVKDQPDKNKKWFKHKMEIYQNIGGTIKGTDCFPSGNRGEIIPVEFPSIDTNDLWKERVNFINKLFENTIVYEIRGKLDDVLDEIEKIVC